MLSLFQDNFILVEATSSHFFRVTTSTQQLLFRSSYFFRTAVVFPFSEQLLFRRSYFFRIASFSKQKFYRAATSWEYEVLYGSYLSEQLIFLEELFRIRISKNELLFQSRYFCTASTFSQKSYIFEKTDFSENHFPYYLLFLESCLFRATTFSKYATFIGSCLFGRVTFFQHSFSGELLFQSYGSFRQSFSHLFVIQ